MSWQLATYGMDTKAIINGRHVGLTGGSVRQRGDTHDVTDSESSPAGDIQVRRRKIGLTEVEIELRGRLAKDFSPFAPPLALFVGTTVATIQVFPDGEDVAGDQFSFTVLDEFEETFGDPQQPNSFRLHGYCSIYQLRT